MSCSDFPKCGRRPAVQPTPEQIRSGIAAGELKADMEADAALDALFGPSYSRLVMRRMPFERGYVDRLAQTVLARCKSPRHRAACRPLPLRFVEMEPPLAKPSP
jgi:hypothetical protein